MTYVDVMAQIMNIDGRTVRALRERLVIDGQTFAGIVGISAPYLSRIEQGVRRPRPPVIARIASALGVTVEDITVLDDAA